MLYIESEDSILETRIEFIWHHPMYFMILYSNTEWLLV